MHFPRGAVDESKYYTIACSTTDEEDTAIKNGVGKRYEHKLDFLSLKGNLVFQMLPRLKFGGLELSIASVRYKTLEY